MCRVNTSIIMQISTDINNGFLNLIPFEDELVRIGILLFLIVQCKELALALVKLFVFRLDEVEQIKWKEDSLINFLGPLFVQIDRVESALFLHEKDENIALQLAEDSMYSIQNLVVNNLHLVPNHLIIDAQKMLKYCDIWGLKIRKIPYWLDSEYKNKCTLLELAREDFPFMSSERFKSHFDQYWKEMYSFESLNLN